MVTAKPLYLQQSTYECNAWSSLVYHLRHSPIMHYVCNAYLVSTFEKPTVGASAVIFLSPTRDLAAHVFPALSKPSMRRKI